MGPALLVERGWAGFPCHPGTKIPAWARGLNGATFDWDTLTGWWERHPHDNVAVNCGKSGLCAVDLDRKHGVDGVAGFADLCDRHGQPWPATMTNETPGGGLHLIFAGVTRSSVGRVGPGIDVKSRGGYILIPDSQVDRRFYHQAVTADLLPLPDWVRALTEPAANVSKAFSLPERQPSPDRLIRWASAILRDETAQVAATPADSHRRNNRLFYAALKAGSLTHILDSETVAAQLTAAGLAAGLDLAETARAVRNGLTAGAHNPRWPQ